MKMDVFQRIENAARPDFGDILSKSFELFQKLFKEAVLHGLVSLLVVVPFFIVVYVPIVPMYVEILQNAGDPYYRPSVLEDFSTVFIIGWMLLVFVLAFVLQVVSMSITVHFYKVTKNEDMGTNDETGGYFDLLKNNFGKLMMLSLATLGIAVLATLLCYLPIFYVMVPLQLIVPILAFNEKLNTSDIIKAAFKLGNKYWLIAFGLIWLSSLIAQLGIILCGIGIVFTAYFLHVVVYYFYKDSVGFDDAVETF
ncbi:MAG: hypothetical protein AAF489_03065 [Bacteroidota bacterium]